jgi:hypothetical protein
MTHINWPGMGNLALAQILDTVLSRGGLTDYQRGAVREAVTRLQEMAAEEAPQEASGPDEGIAPGEYAKAVLAGYLAYWDEGGWVAQTWDHKVISRHGSERAAWEACDRHRMFGDEEAVPLMDDEFRPGRDHLK